MQIPYNGWVVIDFRLLDNETSETSIPFLVACEETNYLSRTTNLEYTNINALINFTQNDLNESLCAVRSKRNVVISKGQSVNVACCANTGPIEQ